MDTRAHGVLASLNLLRELTQTGQGMAGSGRFKQASEFGRTREKLPAHAVLAAPQRMVTAATSATASHPMHGSIAHVHHVASSMLGGVQRAVRAGQGLSGRLLLRFTHTDADTDRQRNDLSLPLHLRVFHQRA